MVRQLAAQLWQARSAGKIVPVSSIDPPADEDAAYAVQEAISDIAAADAAKIVGFKVGATTDAGVAALNLTEPFHGPLLDRYCHLSGGEVALSSQHQVLIETEIAVGLGDDLPPRETDYEERDVLSAASWIAPAFELVATRFDIQLAGNGKLLIADGGVNAGFVLGEKSSEWDSLDLSQHPVTLLINDQEAASGHSGMSMFGNPFRVVTWLANHRQLHRRGLKMGDIITTGTCTGMTPIQAGDHASANLGPLGTVALAATGS